MIHNMVHKMQITKEMIVKGVLDNGKGQKCALGWLDFIYRSKSLSPIWAFCDEIGCESHNAYSIAKWNDSEETTHEEIANKLNSFQERIPSCTMA